MDRLEYGRAYRAANKERIQAYMRDYYLRHEGATRERIIPGATRGSKVCPTCGVEKLRDEFTVRKTGTRSGHLSGNCKVCAASGARGTYQVKNERDPTLYRRVEWPSKLRRNYGITVDDYNRMLREQNGGCALCGSTTPVNGNRQYKRRLRTAFDVDHDHKTGRVRGLLCTRCNRLVGLANDSVIVARNLLTYLSKGE